MASDKTCAACGHVNGGDALFCSKCGARIREQAAAPPPEPAPEPPPPEPPRTASQPPQRRVAGSAKTMLGVPMDTPPASAAQDATTLPDAAPPGSAPEKPIEKPPVRVAGSAKTMLGMPAPDAGQIQAAVEVAKRAKAAEREEREARERSDTAPVAHAELAQVQQPAPGARPEAPPKKRYDVGPSNRTMLGQPAPRVDKPPADEPAGQALSGDARADEAPASRSSLTDDEIVLPTRKPSRALTLVLGVFAAIAFIGGAAALAWVLFAGGSGVRASVVQGEQGEELEIEVPGAAAGTRVRFRGAEQALDAGRARFPLAADALSIGDNELSVDVVAPGGGVETHTVELHLELRVRADLGGLSGVPPAFDVVVEAPSGSEVTLDGQALELDPSGRGQRRYPVDPTTADAEGLVRHVVRYRIHPPQGEIAQGELRTRVPVTSLQLDRPGREVITDREELEIAGAVAPGATVTVDGQEVVVQMGRFVHRVTLALGERDVEVIARARGKAPRIERIHARRVADLEAEAARFEVDAQLTYPRVAQSPAIYRGRHAAFTGMVYNVLPTRSGRGELQLLVDDCADSTGCALWVTYPASIEVAVRARVRVLGTVAGDQQFRSQSGQVRTVPRLDATFVLPASAPRRR